MLALKEFPEIEQFAGAMLAPYQFGSSNSRYQWRGRDIEFGVAEVTDGFKDVMGLQVVEGRWFNREDDGQTYEPVVINAEMRRDLFGDGPAIGQNISNDRSPDQSEVETPRRVVGVVAAYREDGEFDGERNYVLYRKTMEGAGADTRHRDRPPRNLLIKVRPGTTAEFEERLIKRLQAVAPEWSFEVSTLALDARHIHPIRHGAPGGRRPGRRLPDADGGARPAGRAVAERHAAHARDGLAPRERGGQSRRPAPDPRRDRA